MKNVGECVRVGDESILTTRPSGEIGRRTILRGWRFLSCGFESRLGHKWSLGREARPSSAKAVTLVQIQQRPQNIHVRSSTGRVAVSKTEGCRFNSCRACKKILAGGRVANGSRLLIYREKSHREFESHPVSFLLPRSVMAAHNILAVGIEVRLLSGQLNWGISSAG